VSVLEYSENKLGLDRGNSELDCSYRRNVHWISYSQLASISGVQLLNNSNKIVIWWVLRGSHVREIKYERNNRLEVLKIENPIGKRF